MIKKVDHVAIVVKNLDEALQLYDKLLGVKPSHVETVPEQGVKAALLPIAQGGEIELLEPLSPDSGIGKFLATRGEGMHHICLETDNVEEEIKSMSAKGMEMIDKKPRKGLAGMIAFMHPKSTRGVLVELAQKPRKG